MEQVKRTERGWCGHFIGGADCQYHRNTLLEYGDKKIVVSTIGRYVPERNRDFLNQFVCAVEYKMFGNNIYFETVGADRYFETMAFGAYESEDGYWDANAGERVLFSSNWQLDRPDMEKEADEMHEAVVAEITQDLLNGTLTIERYDDESE